MPYWVCHCKPAATGATCGHINTKGVMFNGRVLCCEKCGCTKKASDDRKGRTT